METTGVPGIAVTVVYDDEVVHAQGYGVRDVETGEPTTPETIFEVASLSKSISVASWFVQPGTAQPRSRSQLPPSPRDTGHSAAELSRSRGCR